MLHVLSVFFCLNSFKPMNPLGPEEHVDALTVKQVPSAVLQLHHRFLVVGVIALSRSFHCSSHFAGFTRFRSVLLLIGEGTVFIHQRSKKTSDLMNSDGSNMASEGVSA